MSKAKRLSFSLFHFEWEHGEEADPGRESDVYSTTERVDDQPIDMTTDSAARAVGFARNGEKRAFE